MFNATTILVTALALMVSVAHAKDIDSEYEAAVALIKTKNYAAAQTLLASVIESAQKTGVKASTPMLVKAYYATGYIYEKQEASSEAISDYLAVIRLSLALRVDDPEARDKAGRAFAALERLSPGRAEVLKAAANLETAALDMDDAEKRSLISIVASMRDQVFAFNPTDRVPQHCGRGRGQALRRVAGAVAGPDPRHFRGRSGSDLFFSLGTEIRNSLGLWDGNWDLLEGHRSSG